MLKSFALPRSVLCVAFAAVTGAQSVEENITANNFLRRAYHSSTTAESTVYLYGGLVSYTNDDGPQFVTSSSITALDLSKDWTNSTVQLSGRKLPQNVPDLDRSVLWYHSSEKLLYTGLVGEPAQYIWDVPQVKPSLWTYDPAKDSWNQVLSNTSVALSALTRVTQASTAQTDDTGYALTGRDGNGYGLPGMLELGLSSHNVFNTTVTPATFPDFILQGKMQFVPTWGSKGLMIALGGMHGAAEQWPKLNTIPVFDVDAQKWYSQLATGTAPASRSDHCVAGAQSTNGTYEIFFYGGLGSDAVGPSSIAFDTIDILTLPGFHWVNVPYDPGNPRVGHTCQQVGNARSGQILVVGGADGTQSGNTSKWMSTPDPNKLGLGIFDLQNLTWMDSYVADSPPYAQSDSIREFYTSSGGSYEQGLIPEVRALVTKPVASDAASSSTTTTAPTATATPAVSSSTNKAGVIAGSVIGSLTFVTLLVVAAFLLLRHRRKRRGGRHPTADDNSSGSIEKDANLSQSAEMSEDKYQTRAPAEMIGQHWVHEAGGEMVHEAQGTEELYELEGSRTPRT